MSVKGDRAYELFKQGYNCSQAVFGAFCEELGVDFETSVKLASGFGGGIGRMREVCGTFTGLTMAASLIYGYSDPEELETKKELYEKIRLLGDRFRQDNGSIICRELLGLTCRKEEPTPAERTAEYYKKRPCVELVAIAARIVGEKINAMDKL